MSYLTTFYDDINFDTPMASCVENGVINNETDASMRLFCYYPVSTKNTFQLSYLTTLYNYFNFDTTMASYVSKMLS